eukprot:scaffold43440_cov63-Phaeocystis_antarctica.AAC.2
MQPQPRGPGTRQLTALLRERSAAAAASALVRARPREPSQPAASIETMTRTFAHACRRARIGCVAGGRRSHCTAAAGKQRRARRADATAEANARGAGGSRAMLEHRHA